MNEVYGWIKYYPEVVEKYGYIRALIHGEELSQLNLTGIISKNKIAKHLKMGRRTVVYHTKIDVETHNKKQFYKVRYKVIERSDYIAAIIFSIIEASYNYSKGIIKECYISQDKLAKIAGFSRSTIQRGLKRLIDKGIIFYLEDVRYKETRKIGINLDLLEESVVIKPMIVTKEKLSFEEMAARNLKRKLARQSEGYASKNNRVCISGQ